MKRLKHFVIGRALVDAGVMVDADGRPVDPGASYEVVTEDFTARTTTCWRSGLRGPAWTEKIPVEK